MTGKSIFLDFWLIWWMKSLEFLRGTPWLVPKFTVKPDNKLESKNRNVLNQ